MAAADEGGERSGLSKRRLSAGDMPRKKPKLVLLAAQIAAARGIINSQGVAGEASSTADSLRIKPKELCAPTSALLCICSRAKTI